MQYEVGRLLERTERQQLDIKQLWQRSNHLHKRLRKIEEDSARRNSKVLRKIERIVKHFATITLPLLVAWQTGTFSAVADSAQKLLAPLTSYVLPGVTP